MLSNHDLIPQLLGRPISELDIWHGSSDAEPGFLEYIPQPYLDLWHDDEKEWVASLFESSEFRDVRERVIEIERQLDGLRPGPERSALVKELFRLRYG